VPAMPSFSNSSIPQMPAGDLGDSMNTHNATPAETAPIVPILVNPNIPYPARPQQRGNPRDMDRDVRDDRPECHFVVRQASRAPASPIQTQEANRRYLTPTEVPPTVLSPSRRTREPDARRANRGQTSETSSMRGADGSCWFHQRTREPDARRANRGRTSETSSTHGVDGSCWFHQIVAHARPEADSLCGNEVRTVQRVGQPEQETVNSEDVNAQSEPLRYKREMINERRRDEELSRILRAQEVDQKRVRAERETTRREHDERLRQVRGNQASLETEMGKEMESIRAVARAGSVISTAAPSIAEETVAPGARDIVETLTGRALVIRGHKAAREINGSPAPSSIEKIASDKPASLTFSPSLSRSVGEVECVQFERTGCRCSTDITRCDCHAYDRDNEDREYWRSLRLRNRWRSTYLTRTR
jgi:hypothetical protein